MYDRIAWPTGRQRGLGGLLRLFRGKAHNLEEVEGVLDSREFERALQRECSRANRIGMPLSLLVVASPALPIKVSARGNHQTVLVKAAQFLTSRLRCTDVVGQFDGSQLGVLLPHTPAGAAWQLVDELKSVVEESVRDRAVADDVAYRVFACPFEDPAGRRYYRQSLLFRGRCPVRAKSVCDLQGEQGAAVTTHTPVSS